MFFKSFVYAFLSSSLDFFLSKDQARPNSGTGVCTCVMCSLKVSFVLCTSSLDSFLSKNQARPNSGTGISSRLTDNKFTN